MDLKNSSVRIAFIICSIFVLFSSSYSAFAQALEEVIVTAQKREQDLQDVSIPVTAISMERIQANQVITLEDLQYIAPNVSFGNSVGFAKIFVRGIGLNDQTAGIDPSVALHVDGAVINDPTAHFTSLFDLERVEVLRGPQGILYGRNATGGSLNLITAKPTREFEAHSRITYGKYDQILAEGAVSGPLTDIISGRVAFRVNSRDGYGINEATGSDVDDANQKGVRGHLQFDFSEDVDLLLTTEWYNEDDSALGLKFKRATFPQYLTQLDPDPVVNAQLQQSIAPLGLGGFPTGERNFASEFDPQNDKETWSVTGTFNWRINDGFSVTNIINYREVDGLFVQDLDQSAVVNRFDETGNAPTVHTRTINSEQFSEELQLHYTSDRLTGLVAFYFFSQDMDGDNRSGLSPVAGLPGLTQQRVVLKGTGETNSYSVFANFTYDVIEQLSLKLGGRFTSEDRSIDNNNTIVVFAGGPARIGQPLLRLFTINATFADDKSTNDFSPMAGLEWRPTDDMMLYYTYSEGFKSAVGLLGQTVDGVVEPETIKNHEFGLKSKWFNGSLILNLAAFTYVLEDLQLGRTLPAGGGGAGFVNRFENAAELESTGVEAEIFWQVTDQFSVNGSVSWLNAEFTEFNTVDQFDPCLVLASCTAPLLSWAGNRPRNSPEWAYNIHGEYDFPLVNSSVMTLATDISFKDEQFFSEFNNDVQRADPYTLVDARLTYTSANEHWSATAWGKNLTDELINAGTFAVSLTRTVGQTFLAPRTYGVTIDYRF